MLACAALAVPAAAFAEEMPRQGDFRITFTATSPAAAKPVTIGGNRTVSAGINMMSAVNESGGRLLHDMAGRCTSAPLIDNEARTVENHGYCDYVDADGDHVFEKWDFPSQPLAAAISGTGEWIGGTGKFAGLSGSIKIVSRRLNSPTEGAAQFIGEKTGHYSFEKAVATAR